MLLKPSLNRSKIIDRYSYVLYVCNLNLLHINETSNEYDQL